MISVEQQIENGQLVCPISYQRLVKKDNTLRTSDGRFVYPFISGVPIMLDQDRQRAYLDQLDGTMEKEYTQFAHQSTFVHFLKRLSYWGGDYRSSQANQAFDETIVQRSADELCLSVGGGPLRIHPNLVNVNIGLFDNVDVVGDAYSLPYASGVVDAVYCEAVLEHLEYPNEAVAEMYRVLRPEGQLYAVTPFLQRFHGYPNHYQNFTLVGHQRLFARAGFTILSAGVCVGPTYALLDLFSAYVRYAPTRFLSKALYGGLRLASVAIRPLDRWLNSHPDVHKLASTTYVHVVKGVVISE